MRAGIAGLMRGGSLKSRAMRSSGFSTLGFGAHQALRLGSNLVLTRLLFPEAFGMMALVAMILQGLAMFSDTGVRPAILRSARGDDMDFLNTAWTIQVGRGFLLWIAACGLAWPLAAFYGEPELAAYLPVAALSLIVAGFNPTRRHTANRHLRIGRVTAIEIVAQTLSLLMTIGLAALLASVWALVFSHVIGAMVSLILATLFLPGKWNRLRWDRSAAQELISFGKWIFLSTAGGFFFTQGDKIVLGRYLSLETFGIYNIGFFLASFPLMLGRLVTNRVLIPIYRERPPDASADNFAALRKMRVLVTSTLLTLLMVAAYAGAWAVEVLYDPRYAMAGAVVVMIAAMQVPQVVGLTYDQAALAAGDSRRFFILTATKASLALAGLVIGFEVAGLAGALIAQGIGFLMAYPVLVWLARRQGAWDPAHDALFIVLGTVLAAGAIWVNWPSVAPLFAERM